MPSAGRQRFPVSLVRTKAGAPHFSVRGARKVYNIVGDFSKLPEEVIGEFDYIWQDHITNWRQMK
ncbi:hypothetical protein [Secundilactobacillus kimchicus]|uniref:hypothetical protein n=1 Tax=Secundilactobacillus kimchicus TaxID=528209 RepID=UPI000ACE233D|nr:hypothetical protein [Secundilactobacillus kimchicus]